MKKNIQPNSTNKKQTQSMSRITKHQLNQARTYIVNGKDWLEYTSILSGYENFAYKGKRVYKFELFWSGINPFDVVACKNGFSCNVVIKERSRKK